MSEKYEQLFDFSSGKPNKPKEKPVKQKAPIFQFLDAMTWQKKYIDFDVSPLAKSYDKFMINRWVSMVDAWIPVAQELNINGSKMDDQSHFNFLKSVLPQQKIHFDYIKKRREVTKKELRYIAHYLEVGIKETEMYLLILDDDDVKNIVNQYKWGNNKSVEI